MSTRPAAVVVLAAGEGTRMKSSTPKVLHEIAGRSLVGHAIGAARGLNPQHLAVVVGHGREQVTEHLREIDPEIVVAVQEQQLGTGHAVQCALAALPDDLDGIVVVTYGDVPMLEVDTLEAMLDRHVTDGNGVTILTADSPDPTGYGRVVRDADGGVRGVVEHKDADEATLLITEINSGIYAFEADVLRAGLSRLTTDNAQGELYLTDVVGLTREAGRRVGAAKVDDAWQTEGVNDRIQLAAMGREINRRILDHWMREGVTIIDPLSTWIDADVELGRDVTILPGVQLHGATTIGEGADIGPDSTLRDSVVGPGASVARTHALLAEIGPAAEVGPFTYLRPGATLGAGAKVGAFVEVKASTVGGGAKVPHLTYVGDAEIGAGSNIGAGTIFANYDGVAKHRTTVGKHAFVGSDTVLVAPVEIADGAYVAAGSTVTSAVAPGQLAVARGRQRNIDGWVARKRAGSASAAAAEAAAESAAGQPSSDENVHTGETAGDQRGEGSL